MSRYHVNKVLWQVAKQPGAKAAFEADPAAYLRGRELTKPEHEALAGADIRALFQLGAHPFLLYSFALVLAGGFSVAMMEDYVAKLAGLQLLDITT